MVQIPSQSQVKMYDDYDDISENMCVFAKIQALSSHYFFLFYYSPVLYAVNFVSISFSRAFELLCFSYSI